MNRNKLIQFMGLITIGAAVNCASFATDATGSDRPDSDEIKFMQLEVLDFGEIEIRSLDSENSGDARNLETPANRRKNSNLKNRSNQLVNQEDGQEDGQEDEQPDEQQNEWDIGDPDSGGDDDGFDWDSGYYWGNTPLVILSQIVNLGKKVWQMMEKNRPVVNFKVDTANALPQGVQSPSELQSWSVPENRTFQVSYNNGFGRSVVDFSFRVMYVHGGNFKGKGKYLSQLTILPEMIHAKAGFKVNAIVNASWVGNRGTDENPMAGAHLDLRWSVGSLLNHYESSATFGMQGDGAFMDVGQAGSRVRLRQVKKKRNHDKKEDNNAPQSEPILRKRVVFLHHLS